MQSLRTFPSSWVYAERFEWSSIRGQRIFGAVNEVLCQLHSIPFLIPRSPYLELPAAAMQHSEKLLLCGGGLGIACVMEETLIIMLGWWNTKTRTLRATTIVFCFFTNVMGWWKNKQLYHRFSNDTTTRHLLSLLLASSAALLYSHPLDLAFFSTWFFVFPLLYFFPFSISPFSSGFLTVTEFEAARHWVLRALSSTSFAAWRRGLLIQELLVSIWRHSITLKKVSWRFLYYVE